MSQTNLIEFVRWISTYLYHLLFIIIMAICFLAPIKQTSEPVPTSKKHIAFDKSKNPTIFTWASDLHVASHWPKAVSNLKKFLELSDTVYHPDNVILSGDMVDNYDSDKFPKKSFNNEIQWQLFTSIRDSTTIPKENFFEPLGNHDTWGIKSTNHKTNLPDKYTSQPMLKTIVTKEVNNVRLISFYPQEPPTGVGIHSFFPKLKKKYMDLFEEEINKPTNADATIVITHFTSFSLYPKSKSSKGSSYSDLVSSPKVHAFFAGHTHPTKYEIWHHKSGLEIVCPHLKAMEMIGVITVDNGRLVLTQFTFDNYKKAIITSPVDDKYATRVEPSNDFVIRLLSFDPSIDLSYKVTGAVTGTLSFERTVRNGVNLYSMDAHLENGHHKIHISGPNEIELDCDFSIGVSTKKYSESQHILIRPIGLIALIVLFILFHVVVGVGMFIPWTALNDCNTWMDTRDNTDHYYLLAIFGGPLITGNRLSHLPIWLRCIFVFFIIWPLFIPTVIFTVGDSIGVSWMYGYMIDGETKADFINILYCGIYYAGPLSFLFFFLSLYVLKVRWYMIFDILYWIIVLAVSIFADYRFGNEIAPFEQILGSFSIFIFPMIFLIISIVYLVKKILRSKTEESQNEEENEKQLSGEAL